MLSGIRFSSCAVPTSGFFHLNGVPELALHANNHAQLIAALTQTSSPGTLTDEDLLAHRGAWAEHWPLASMLNWYRALPAAGASHARIKCPVSVIWGNKNSALDKNLVERGAAECESTEVSHLKDVRHWVHHEKPNWSKNCLANS